MKITKGKSFTARIYIAGDYKTVLNVCREYTMVGLCVQVKECDYVFTGGLESGAEITLINYMRFPSDAEDITATAIDLASVLIKKLYQLSASVVTDNQSIFIATDKKR